MKCEHCTYSKIDITISDSDENCLLLCENDGAETMFCPPEIECEYYIREPGADDE